MGEGRILVVDNEPQIRRVMRTTLIADGFEVADARTGDEALEQMRSAKYDLVLLDINMPGMNGFEACQAIRSISETPIIMLTVRAADKDKVQAFESGADDYVTKPFSTPELLARIDVAMRKNRVPTTVGRSKVQLGEIEIDFEARQVTGSKGPIRLTPTEFELLSYLVAHANKSIGHRELLRAIWGPDYGGENEYLRVFINHLRKKLERTPAKPKYLLTDPWVGYRLHLPK
jgi:two-component system KDP operon response regulator KdpE